MHVFDIYLRPHDLEQSPEVIRCFSLSYIRGYRWAMAPQEIAHQRESIGDGGLLTR